MARGIDTKCIHLEEDEGQCSHYGALSYPIYQTATYAHPGVGPQKICAPVRYQVCFHQSGHRCGEAQ